jgi:uncharacterized protein YeaO (DUF488 family)
VSRRGQARVEIRRVYDGPPEAGPHRVLIDRLWPRGIAKADAPFDEWAKEVAPSTELRRWYGHDPAKFDEFARRYRDELALSPANDGLARLCVLAEKKGIVLVTATRDVEHSGAEVLLDVLVGRIDAEPSRNSQFTPRLSGP